MAILTCTGCGATKPARTGAPTDLYPSEHCGQCPPWQCADCGETCSAADMCSCWTRVSDLSTADMRALFARDGTFTLGVPHRPDDLAADH